jgi:hypothetical protein
MSGLRLAWVPVLLIVLASAIEVDDEYELPGVTGMSNIDFVVE